MSYDQPAAPDSMIDVSAMLGAVVQRLPRIILISAGLLAITFVVLMFMPRLYESSASILVEPRSNVYVRPSNEQAPSLTGGEVGVVSSQIELIKSRDTLLKVIDELDLRSDPEFNGAQSGFSPLGLISQLMGRRPNQTSIDEIVVNNLYSRLSVSQERDSRLISVSVQSTDPQRAAEIANAIANAHIVRRAQLSLSDTAEASSWLLDEIGRLRVSVRDAEAAVAQFKVDNDLLTGQNNSSLLDQQMSAMSAQITASQERKSAALSRASLIRGMIERGQPVDGLDDVRQSAVIQQLSQEKARLQGELAQRSATLLASHPSIRALNAQIGELDRQIRLEGSRVAEALDAEAQIEADLQATLQADLARLKSTASVATRDTVDLDGLEREAKAQRDLLEAYLLRYNEASSRVDTNSALPDVRVVSVAAPSVTPASPKVTLIMLAVGIVSFVVQIGLVLFGELMSGRAISPVPSRNWREDEPAPSPVAPYDGHASAPAASAEMHSAYSQDVVEDPAADLEPEETLVIQRFAPPEAPPAAPHRNDEATQAFLRAVMADPVAEDAESPQVPPPASVTEKPAAPPTQTRSPRRSRPPALLRYVDLAADLVLGSTHLLLLADHAQGQAAAEFAEELVREALGKGLSVALVDAGTGRRTDAPGLTDLSTGQAAFGDVVQKSADNSFAEIVWGRGRAIDRQSPRPMTLIEALGDIYEVVVVLTGPVGPQSSLFNFAELGGRVVLVAEAPEDIDLADAVRRRLLESGLPSVEIASLAEPVAA